MTEPDDDHYEGPPGHYQDPRLPELLDWVAAQKENPVQLLENPPSKDKAAQDGPSVMTPVVQGALVGAGSAAVDFVVSRVLRGTKGMMVAAVAKVVGGAVLPLGVKKEWARDTGQALIATGAYQGAVTGFEMWASRSAAPPPAALPAPSAPPALPPAPTTEGLVYDGAPPGYQFVPGVGYVHSAYLSGGF